MSLSALIASPILKSALELVLPIVHETLGGGRTADKIVGKIQLKSLEIDGKRIAAQQSILMRELEGSWIQRSWRPVAMFVFIGLLIYQVIIVTVINAFWPDTIKPDAQLTLEIIAVIKWGLSGYIVARSGEKIAKTWQRSIAETERHQRELKVAKDDGLKPRKVPKDATIEEVPFMRNEVDE